MLKLIKNLLAKKETQPKEIHLEEAGNWLDEKEKEIQEQIKSAIVEIIDSIKSEKEKAFDNLNHLEKAELQNPNISNRAKTVMEGNREAFIRKTKGFFEKISFEHKNTEETKQKCRDLKKEIDALAKATEKGYRILNEFFAREVSAIAENIRKISTHSKDIINVIEGSKLNDLEELRKHTEEVQNKIKRKKDLALEKQRNVEDLGKEKEKAEETRKKIEESKKSRENKELQKLLEEKEKLQKELKEIESRIFHDFSVLQKALKKYSKIALENQHIIQRYLENPVKALEEDESLEITKVLENLRKSLEGKKLDLDEKKTEKALSKIKNMRREYVKKSSGDYKEKKKKIKNTEEGIKNNEANKKIKDLEEQLYRENKKIESLEEKNKSIQDEIGKIDVEKLKKDLEENANMKLKEKIIIKKDKNP